MPAEAVNSEVVRPHRELVHHPCGRKVLWFGAIHRPSFPGRLCRRLTGLLKLASNFDVVDYYLWREKFAVSRFEKNCLSEYAEVFRTVCVDAAYYTFPSVKYLEGRIDDLAPPVRNYAQLCLRTPKAKDKRVVPGSFYL